MNESNKTSVAIVGAGLIGTTLSYFLSFNSNLEVTVYDRSNGNANITSYANAGRFVPIGKLGLSCFSNINFLLCCLVYTFSSHEVRCISQCRDGKTIIAGYFERKAVSSNGWQS